jgi:hypothetical protein
MTARGWFGGLTGPKLSSVVRAVRYLGEHSKIKQLERASHFRRQRTGERHDAGYVPDGTGAEPKDVKEIMATLTRHLPTTEIIRT